MEIPPMEEIFGPGGVFARSFPGFEHRSSQTALAEEVRKILSDEEDGLSLAAEAPPGVGKTFALLAPAMLRAAAGGKTILVLTAGIPLQEQLIEKDLPALNSLLGLKLPFGLLKGRGNYACLLRAEEAADTGENRGGYLSFGDGGDASARIAEWITLTATGDLSELSLPPGSPAIGRIASSWNSCLGAACPLRDRCFVTKMIREAQNWSVVVANYHLYFSWVLGAGKAFPVPFDILICDEAHRLAEAARSALTISVSWDEIVRLLRSRVLSEGASDLPLSADSSKDSSALARQIRDEAARFFDLLEVKIPARKGSMSVRNEEIWHQQSLLSSKIADLLHFFAPLEENQGEEEGKSALSIWLEDLRRVRSALIECAGVSSFPSRAYWKDGRSLSSAPAAPSAEIARSFELGAPEKTFYISATLTLGGKWDYWLRETGLTPSRFFQGTSPFNLEEQMEILVVDTGLEVRDPGYDETLCRVIEKLVEKNGGSSLVLLSSKRLMTRAAEALRKKPRSYNVLVQGELPRTELLRLFRGDRTSVLVGSASFREGVDVPGDGLTQVIIDRIPFAHPDDPIVQARSALEGGEAFRRTILPEAKMLLKQAAGRLIRSTKDRGIVAILDGRVLERRAWNIPSALPKVKYRRLLLSRNGHC